MTKLLNMTEGRPLSLLIRFAVPLSLGCALQLLYTLADGAIVGRLLGVRAFAAVSAAWFPYWTVLDSILGLTQGFGALFAQRFGAKDIPGLRTTVASAILVSCFLGLALSFTGAFLSKPALVWLHTPPALMEEAALYLRILLGGIFVSFFYNLLGALLRSLGNSQTPVYAMVFSAALNILLDILFVTIFPLGVAGVAVATLLAQAFACVYCILKLRRVPEIKLTRADFRWNSAASKALLRLGGPMGLRNGIISLGGLAVQRAVNGYGIPFVAGVAVAKRLYALLEIIGAAMEGAVATFAAQNYGAQLFGRIRQGVKAAAQLLLAASVIIMTLTFFFGRSLMGLLLVGSPEEIAAVLDVGQQQLRAMAWGLPALYLLLLYRSALQGQGKALSPMLSGFMELGMRIVFVLWAPLILGRWGVYLADTAGWVAASLQLFTAYHLCMRARHGRTKNA